MVIVSLHNNGTPKKGVEMVFLSDCLSVGVLVACMAVQHVHTVPLNPEEGIRSPGVSDSCELPRGCWDEQPVL